MVSGPNSHSQEWNWPATFASTNTSCQVQFNVVKETTWSIFLWEQLPAVQSRCVGERTVPWIDETVPNGGGSVMVYGMCGRRRIELVVFNWNRNAKRYIDLMTRPVVLHFLQRRPRILFQQDDARPHAARVVQQFLATNNVNVLSWPARLFTRYVIHRTFWG